MSLAALLPSTKCITPFGDERAPNLLLSVYGGPEQLELARGVLLGPPRELDFHGVHFAHAWVEACPGHFATFTIVRSRALGPLVGDLRREGLTNALLHEPVTVV